MPGNTAAAKLQMHIKSYDEGIRRHASLIETYEDRDMFFIERKLEALTLLVEKRSSKVESLREVLMGDEEGLGKVNDDEFVVMEEYDTAASMLLRMIDARKPKKEERGNPSPPPSSRPRIPEMPLPYFQGNLNEWIAYKTNFCSLIKDNVSIDNAAKLYYLRQSLRGPAANIQSAADTFDALWAAVCKRFENRRVIVDCHIEELIQFKPIRQESSADLRRFLDLLLKNLRVLDSLQLPVDPLAEQFVINLVTNKLDNETRKSLEGHFESDVLPNLEVVCEFLDKRCHTLESIERSKGQTAKTPQKMTRPSRTEAFATTTEDAGRRPIKCPMCEKPHYLNQCPEFLQLDIANRWAQVKRVQYCTNCLSPGHKIDKCRSGTCRECRKKHHSLLHQTDRQSPIPIPTTSAALTSQVAPQSANVQTINKGLTLLSTIVMLVYDEFSTPYYARAVLDSASEANYVTENLAQILRIRNIPVNIIADGLNGKSTPIRRAVHVTIKSRVSQFTVSLNCLVVPKITGALPARKIDTASFQFPHNIELADPHFGKPRSVDMLIGAELFYSVLLRNQLKLNDDLPALQETVFGWVISGKISDNVARTTTLCTLSRPTNADLQNELKRFWEMESCELPKPFTPEERLIEKHFCDTVTRQPNGRYVVTLPTTPDVNKLGDSYTAAFRRFLSLERRFARNPDLKEAYSTFMTEYEQLEHMVPTKPSTNSDDVNYYLPHHAVLKPDSSTTKLRVVFDGSAITSTGLSLNDVLQIGPTIQQELLEIVLRFRKHRFAFTADVNKMYRQIAVAEHQQRLQQILWRANPTDDVTAYSLKTVTYGTSSAPYLAIRVLQQLAEDERDRFPLAAQVTKTDFYVDDCLSGADTLPAALELQSQLVQLLRSGQLLLHKWCANVPELLEPIPVQHREPKLSWSSADKVKALGVTWQPVQDSFVVRINEFPSQSLPITKRIVSSEIARLYDPLGLIGPIIVTAKCQLQRLWLLKTDWDEPLCDAEAERWSQFREQLPPLKVEVNRCIFPYESRKSVKLIGFCDSSKLAYGACVYIHCTSDSGQISTNLLCSKSKVAPLKATTIPRLELCGALLLARLIRKVKKAMDVQFDDTLLFCDSQIVLCWIKTSSTKLKTFVSHRVAEIQDSTNLTEWRHVPTEDNPADLISRGLMPNQLQNASLWWNGPEFLQQDERQWPPVFEKDVETDECPETKVLIASTSTVEDFPIIKNSSQIPKLERIFGYVLRFIKNSRSPKIDRCVTTLQSEEIQRGLEAIVRVVQRSRFAEEVQRLEANKPVKRTSKLYSLNVFINSDGLLRVGGRMRNAEISFDAKHQILLPKDHHFTVTLIRHMHEHHGHCGRQALLSIIRQTFWPINAKQLIKSVTRSCVICFKVNPKPLHTFMGDLPPNRVTICHPFFNTGVDYAGPLLLKINRRTAVKAYVAVFICMVTKAVHFEVVSDASTAAFIAALQRFISRRGFCQNLYCDNGKNFVGANTELKSIYEMLSSDHHQQSIETVCAQRRIQFHFIPPRAPHFGGLWEAAVKSMKFHLQRIVGNTKLNYEEMLTILTKIEAMMNSRPLFAESDDPNDVTAITPGHFLIGRPLVALAEPNYLDANVNRLKRWELLQKITQHFWQRWSTQYLHNLQQRPNAKALSSKIKIGALVLIKEDNVPPSQWLLGRICNVFPGADNIIRVATLRTAKNILKRPVVKLCLLPLPTEDTEEQEEIDK